MRYTGRSLRWIGTVAISLFLLGNLLNALHKVDDFDVYRAAGQRLVASAPLYANSDVAKGFVGPPAQALLFAPLAMLPMAASQLAWYVINVALLIYAVLTWLRILLGPEGNHGARHSARHSAEDEARHGAFEWRAYAEYLFTPAALLSLLAILRPLQVQFEHQNLNIVLLALAAAAADALTRGRAITGGVWLGLATAIKVYPGLALVWLALRKRWSALASAVATALIVSILPAVLCGFDLLSRYFRDWSAVAGSGWPTRRANQSFFAMWGRYVVGESPEGYQVMHTSETTVLILAAATGLVILAPLVIASMRPPRTTRALGEELACVSALAVLMSPIAWEHYWVAFFPVFVALARRAFEERSRWAAAAFWIGAVGISALSRPVTNLTSPEGIRIVRAMSVMTWAGAILCLTLAMLLARESEPAETRAPAATDAGASG